MYPHKTLKKGPEEQPLPHDHVNTDTKTLSFTVGSFRLYNPECLKASHCHLIPSRLDNAMVFCRISAEARLPYDTVHIRSFTC